MNKKILAAALIVMVVCVAAIVVAFVAVNKPDKSPTHEPDTIQPSDDVPAIAGTSNGIDPQRQESVLDQSKSSVAVTINGEPVKFDQPPVVQDGEIYVPVIAMSEAMGCDANYNDRDKERLSVVIDDIGTKASIDFSTGEVRVNSFKPDGQWHEYNLSTPILDGQTMIPVTTIGEALGYEVRQDVNDRTANITVPGIYDSTPLERKDWYMLCELVYLLDNDYYFMQQNDIYSTEINENTPLETILTKYMYYPLTNSYLLDEDEKQKFNWMDPLLRFANSYEYIALDANATDTIMRELFGADDSDIERLHSIDTDKVYYYDGYYYGPDEGLAEVWAEAYGYEILNINNDGSVNVRVNTSEFSRIGYRDCVVLPNKDTARYPFRLLSIGQFVRTESVIYD